MPPGRGLDGREPQCREAQRQRRHANLRIDEHVHAPADDRLDPAGFIRGIVNVAVDDGLCLVGLLIERRTQMEQMHLESGPIEVMHPALGDGIPDGVFANMGRYEPDPQFTTRRGHGRRVRARSARQANRSGKRRHPQRAKIAVAGQ